MKANLANILVIDDDIVMQRLIMAVLTKAGHIVKTCGSVSEGLDMIGEQMPDMVLCDMALPLISGLDFLKHCRATPELANLTVVIISSVSDVMNAQEALALGAAAHISKPFSQAQLLQVVAEHLPKK
jgi:CheY-like chemotaxis protein